MSMQVLPEAPPNALPSVELIMSTLSCKPKNSSVPLTEYIKSNYTLLLNETWLKQKTKKLLNGRIYHKVKR